ncbi:hypothetical protein JW960_09950, partial [candidate division KSB1 bacterium]|nr:hypothetical protein [candidate division KSB1 bacterium]
MNHSDEAIYYEVIRVMSGTYNENVTMKTKVDIFGYGMPEINGYVRFDNVHTSRLCGFQVNSVNVLGSTHNCYLEDLDIGTGMLSLNNIYDCQIQNVYMYGGSYGMYTTNASIVNSQNNSFVDCATGLYAFYGNTIPLTMPFFCSNNKDVESLAASNNVDLLSGDCVNCPIFSGMPEGSTITDNYNSVDWDDWYACGLAKPSSSADRKIAASSSSSNPVSPQFESDPARAAYAQAYYHYVNTRNALTSPDASRLDYAAKADTLQACISEFRDVVNTYAGTPASANALSQIVHLLCAMGQPKQAEQLIDETIANDKFKPVAPDVERLYITVAMRTNDYDKALNYIDKLADNADKDMDKADALYQKAMIFTDFKNNPDKAAKLLEEILKKYPDTPYANLAAEELGVDGPKKGRQETGADIAIPRKFALSNFPNPFNPSTTIRYDLPHPGHVSLTIYNIRGQLIAALLDEHKPAGSHTAQWDSRAQAGAAA